MTLKHLMVGLVSGLSLFVLAGQAQAQVAPNGSCNGSSRTATFSGGGISSVEVGGSMLATEFVDFTILSGDFDGGNALLRILIGLQGQQQNEFCSGLACNGTRFTAQQDGDFRISIQGRTEDGEQGQVRAVCTAASTGNDEDEDQKGNGLGEQQTRDAIDGVLNQTGRIMSPNAATLAGLALNDGLNFNQGMTQLVSDDHNQGMQLLGKLGEDHIALGFEQRLNASANQSMSGEAGASALLGNVRYYNLSGEIDGDAWQGQIGYRHALSKARSLTVFGTYRASDLDADGFGVEIDEDSYGAGLIYQGSLSGTVTASAMVQYEVGEADILANGATGETDIDRLTIALGLRGAHRIDSVMLRPRIVAGFVSMERDTYRDSAAATINGETTDDFFAEAGIRLTAVDNRGDDLPNWFLDASVDYADETLDGTTNLTGNRISESHWAGNAEAGLRFDLEGGSSLVVSGGGRGLGRESRAVFGNARLTVPLQ